MDQMKRVASRGYAYVACSRFKSRSGCHLYGSLRVSDFLPVGEPQEGEITERGYLSADSDDCEAGHARAMQNRQYDDSDTDMENFVPSESMMHDFLLVAS